MTSKATRTSLLGLLVAAAVIGSAGGADVRQRRGFEIRLTQPETGSFHFGRTEITAEVKAEDPDFIDRVEFFVDDVLIFIDQEPPYHCKFDFGQEPKSWIVRAVAHHQNGVTVTDTAITRRVAINYRIEVDRVLLSALVSRKEHPFMPLPDFGQDDFTLVEDGVPQQILEFMPERRPVTLVLLIDTSGSMLNAMKMVHAAATTCVESLRPEDEVAVVDFDSNVFLLSPFTTVRNESRASIESTFADGGTALYDAVSASYRLLNDVSGPKAIILLSDGEDTDSRMKVDKVIEQAKTSDTIVYSIGLATSFMDMGLRGVLRELAEGTGGRSFFPDDIKGLESVYRQIAHELTNNRYQISYSPSNDVWDGDWRKVDLSMNVKGFKVRTRKGYYAVH